MVVACPTFLYTDGRFFWLLNKRNLLQNMVCSDINEIGCSVANRLMLFVSYLFDGYLGKIP